MSGNGGAFYPSLFCLAANTQVPNLQSSTALLKPPRIATSGVWKGPTESLS